MAPSSVDYFTQILARVVEHFENLGVETRDDNGVKECIETTEDDRTDYNADDDLHARVDIAICSCVIESRLCGNCERICLVLELTKKLLHSDSPPFNYAV